jgi:hypothetical protein
MTGWLRLEPFQAVSDRLCAAGVFTGDLLDSGGTTIGIGSRCRTIPTEIAGNRGTHGLRAGSGARPARPRGAEDCFQRVGPLCYRRADGASCPQWHQDDHVTRHIANR